MTTPYRLSFDGKALSVHKARVSKDPINRRWPGHQREIEQTQIAYFASFSMEAAGVLEIEGIEGTFSLLPEDLPITVEKGEGRLRLTLAEPRYFVLVPEEGAVLHLFADAPHVAPERDENTLYFGPGEHEAGVIELHSGQTLFLDEGAVVYGSVYARGAEGITVTGRGILDNSHNIETILYPAAEEGNRAAVPNAKRSRTLRFEECRNVLVEDITVRDSLIYHINPVGCENVTIRRVKLIGAWRYNSDGIDLQSCRNVLVDSCFLRTFDDAVCVKGMDGTARHLEEKYPLFESLTVQNCTIWCDWGKCLEIGAETAVEEIRHVTFRDCHILSVAGPILDICNVDYAKIEAVRFENIHVHLAERVKKPYMQQKNGEEYRSTDPDYLPDLVKVHVMNHYEYSEGKVRRGTISDVTFDGIHITGSKKTPTLRFAGYDEAHGVKNVVIRNLTRGGVALSEGEVNLICEPFAENVVFENPYAQMEGNTVKAKGQLTGPVRLLREGVGRRYLFVGNSITLHGKNEALGWDKECGMAASCPEKDYVHLLMARLTVDEPDAAFALCQVSAWEKDYKIGHESLPRYEAARDFGADVIVMRFLENCPKDGFDAPLFTQKCRELLSFLSGEKSPRVIYTTPFWRHPGEEAVRALAKAEGATLVHLSDLGEQDEMKALGLFEHAGVARHPGDRGMAAIAHRIYQGIKEETNA